jgi:hypothetical protein
MKRVRVWGSLACNVIGEACIEGSRQVNEQRKEITDEDHYRYRKEYR